MPTCDNCHIEYKFTASEEAMDPRPPYLCRSCRSGARTGGEASYAALRQAADAIVAADDNLLRAIAAIAAHGRIQIMPAPDFLGAKARPAIILPQRMYDRMFQIIEREGVRG